MTRDETGPDETRQDKTGRGETRQGVGQTTGRVRDDGTRRDQTRRDGTGVTCSETKLFDSTRKQYRARRDHMINGFDHQCFTRNDRTGIFQWRHR